jgi:hypothetical protein
VDIKYLNRGNITLIFNCYKKEKTHPDYKGKMDVDGETLHLSLWINQEIKGVPIHLTGQITAISKHEDVEPD